MLRSRLVRLAALVYVSAAPGFSSPLRAWAAPCVDRARAPDGCREDAAPFGDGFTLPVYRIYPLATGAAGVTRAVLVVHGTLRNADSYFDAVVAASARAGVEGTTQVVAPRFRDAHDDGGVTGAGDWPVWSESGWKRGDASRWRGGEGPGSFEVVDALVRSLADPVRYPDLREIVVTGFSAGGQFAHRYAAATAVAEAFPGVSVRFVVGSPSSYLFLDVHRPGPQPGSPTLPSPSACPEYDEYPYGLEAPNAYVAAALSPGLVPRFLARDVAYVSGEDDTGTDYLDTTCAAMLQGPYRFARAVGYLGYLDAEYPGHRHHFHPVAGVGHDHGAIYGSLVGRELLFGPAAARPLARR